MITPKTAVFCVIGNPVAHSMSPVMHNRAFSHTGYDGVYLAFEVTDIRSAVSGMRALGIKGASVTIPHKRAVMDFLDDVADTARRIGAVNTIVHQSGKLLGMNTDCTGAVRAVSAHTALKGKNVMILGAGGAARAVGFGISAEGGEVRIANRSIDKGQALARELDCAFCPLAEVQQYPYDILINTTAVGMTPRADQSPVTPEALKPGLIVMDIVYTPLRTKLLAMAEEAGCIAIDGVKMFVHQGAAQFELWTGLTAPLNVMEETVRAELVEDGRLKAEGV